MSSINYNELFERRYTGRNGNPINKFQILDNRGNLRIALRSLDAALAALRPGERLMQKYVRTWRVYDIYARRCEPQRWKYDNIQERWIPDGTWAVFNSETHEKVLEFGIAPKTSDIDEFFTLKDGFDVRYGFSVTFWQSKWLVVQPSQLRRCVNCGSAEGVDHARSQFPTCSKCGFDSRPRKLEVEPQDYVRLIKGGMTPHEISVVEEKRCHYVHKVYTSMSSAYWCYTHGAFSKHYIEGTNSQTPCLVMDPAKKRGLFERFIGFFKKG